MTLHQLNQAHYSDDIENLWLANLKTGDSVLLLEEAVLRLTQEKRWPTMILDQQVTLYYLEEDLTAYGINSSLGKSLSDEAWVELTLNADKQISW
ncbi:sulfurtransferase complex subunit TusB [Marinomonas epiphytica]